MVLVIATQTKTKMIPRSLYSVRVGVGGEGIFLNFSEFHTQFESHRPGLLGSCVVNIPACFNLLLGM